MAWCSNGVDAPNKKGRQKKKKKKVLSRMQLTSLCDSHSTSRRFALGTSNVCLVGENRACSLPAS